jgi:iron complex outermembrane receptor protein/hemoglobin/transferrin/lactoferrin receptor protein
MYGVPVLPELLRIPARCLWNNSITLLAVAVWALVTSGDARADDSSFGATARALLDDDPKGESRSRVTQREIEERIPRSAPDALRYEPGVSVQQTSHGQASPFVRGLTGQQVLLMFDGIRLNNGLYRQGPNQYFFTVDMQTLDHIDVIRGSASTEYGSDAIGGAIVATPLSSLPDVPEQGLLLKPRASGRFASADLERGGRGEILILQTGETGARVGGGYRVADELESGGIVYNEDGGRPWVPRFRADGRTQVGTGYREATFDARVEHALTANVNAIVAMYGYRQMDAPRTDQCPPPEAPIGTCMAYLHQDRTLIYTALRGEVAENIKALDLSFSWQGQFEELQLTPGTSRFRRRSENRIDTVGLSAHAQSNAWRISNGIHTTLHYGAELYRDLVGSTMRLDLFDFDETETSTRGQYVNGSSYLNTGVFSELETAIGDFTLRAGGRIPYIAARSDGDVASGTKPVDHSWVTAIGRVGASYALLDELDLSLNYDQGFRAPNLDDLTARQQTGPYYQFENADLGPERAHTFEFGSSLDMPWLAVDSWVFTTLIDDAITRAVREAENCPTGDLNCEGARDQIQLVNATGTSVFWGTEGGATLFAPQHVTLRATYGYTWGEQDNTGSRNAQGTSIFGDRVPASRVPPLHGTVELRWRHPATGFFAGAAMSWALEQDRLAPSDIKDARIPRNRTPGYVEFDLRAGLRYQENIRFGLVFENVLDEAYRIHGSSINGPGRGVLLTTSIGL